MIAGVLPFGDSFSDFDIAVLSAVFGLLSGATATVTVNRVYDRDRQIRIRRQELMDGALAEMLSWDAFNFAGRVSVGLSAARRLLATCSSWDRYRYGVVERAWDAVLRGHSDRVPVERMRVLVCSAAESTYRYQLYMERHFTMPFVKFVRFIFLDGHRARKFRKARLQALSN